MVTFGEIFWTEFGSTVGVLIIVVVLAIRWKEAQFKEKDAQLALKDERIVSLKDDVERWKEKSFPVLWEEIKAYKEALEETIAERNEALSSSKATTQELEAERAKIAELEQERARTEQVETEFKAFTESFVGILANPRFQKQQTWAALDAIRNQLMHHVVPGVSTDDTDDNENK